MVRVRPIGVVHESTIHSNALLKATTGYKRLLVKARPRTMNVGHRVRVRVRAKARTQCLGS